MTITGIVFLWSQMSIDHCVLLGRQPGFVLNCKLCLHSQGNSLTYMLKERCCCCSSHLLNKYVYYQLQNSSQTTCTIVKGVSAHIISQRIEPLGHFLRRALLAKFQKQYIKTLNEINLDARKKHWLTAPWTATKLPHA